jgi:hypothetical protein
VVPISSQNLLDQIRCSTWSIFLLQLSADLARPARVGWLCE